MSFALQDMYYVTVASNAPPKMVNKQTLFSLHLLDTKYDTHEPKSSLALTTEASLEKFMVTRKQIHLLLHLMRLQAEDEHEHQLTEQQCHSVIVPTEFPGYERPCFYASW